MRKKPICNEDCFNCIYYDCIAPIASFSPNGKKLKKEKIINKKTNRHKKGDKHVK